MDLYLTPYTKTSAKWIKAPTEDVKKNTSRKKDIEEKPHDVGFGNNFLDMTSNVKATATTTKIKQRQQKQN